MGVELILIMRYMLWFTNSVVKYAALVVFFTTIWQ